MHPHAHRRRSLVAAALLAAVGVPASARAQEHGPGTRRVIEERRVSVAGGHLTLLGANVLLSGVTGGVLRWYRGGSFLEGVLKSVPGGAASYAGKVLAVRGGGAHQFLGRQLAATGASVVRNVGANEPVLSRLSLPFGPLHLHVTPGADRPAAVSVDVLSVAALSVLLINYDADMDWAGSLALAAPVLRVHDPEDRLGWNGRHLAGIVLLRDGYWYEDAGAQRRTLAHERVHLLQYDQLALLWSDPAERALLKSWQWTRAIQPYVDLGLNSSLNAAARLLPVRASPIEIESTFLSQSR